MPVVLFDLGGVLVESNGRSALQRSCLISTRSRSGPLESVEIGRSLRAWSMAEAEFAAAFIQEWEPSMSEEAFLDSFASWVPGCFDGTVKLVRALREQHRVGCLSNTNAIHWSRLTELRDMFDFTFASHLTGLMKPDRQAYELVISTLEVPASEIHFLDDLPVNVSAAREIGINAFVVRGPREAEAILLSNGLLSHAGT